MSTVGVFSCDPGGHTGLAWGLFDPSPVSRGGIADILASRTHTGSQTIAGDARAQVREITSLWHDFYRTCVLQGRMDPKKVFFVCENFQYAPGVSYNEKDGSASISISIIWGIEGYRMGRADQWNADLRGRKREWHVPEMILQQAGQASTFATNPRLREWGIWVPGKDHERSAWKHIALFLQQYSNGLKNAA